MFHTGQKVVCINDQFEPWVYDLYLSLPKKDSTYTVRAMSAGRSNPKFSVNEDAKIQLTDAEFDILLLLKELQSIVRPPFVSNVFRKIFVCFYDYLLSQEWL